MSKIESYWIFIAPPTSALNTAIVAVHSNLIRHGWKLSGLVRIETDGSSGKLPGNLDSMLSADHFVSTFTKEGHGVELQRGNVPGRIDLSPDPDAFTGVEAVKAIFTEMDLPDGTMVIGDSRYRLDSLDDFPRTGNPMADSRLADLGFFWISQLPRHRWLLACRLEPSLSARQLASFRDSCVVLMWDSPHSWREESQRLRGLAKALVESNSRTTTSRQR